MRAAWMTALALAVAACSHGIGGAGPGGAGGGGGGDGTAPGGTWVSGTFANDQGQRDYKLYVPIGYRAGSPVPLLTVLHGCTETADGTDAATRYSTLADARTFLVVYPQQSSAANSLLCWSWFDAGSQVRGKGEASIIAGITQKVMSDYAVDAARVWIIGPSAGGAMSGVMGATYPDLYAAIGVVSGCEFGGLPCNSSGGPDPVGQGQLAYQAMAARARVVPVIVFHGDMDAVAAPVNGQQVTAQWLATDDWADNGAHDGSIAVQPASTNALQAPNGGRSYDLAEYVDGGGQPLLDYYVIHGEGHAWPGGAASAAWTDPSGPDASTISLDFFAAHPHR